ncbi:MAG: bifunctional 4-hydroxy-2-oxoglutarate aldolase/2-dehydro-3-deoxy-phosphogluconate aldolase [Segetibacter sp.]|jgi:2-dehydro-3-deoxyphosphogluconate aldolase/(4S)-4-hydroxy-2-oxoglutarate aldolase|nr:bifunctional 4-hydroxy-2-oxoglutarate aldolase/2-dehydro-3-deoxy-phosphogluconate aldolase [Segetibacter sp.]
MSQQATIQTVLDYPIVPVFYNPDPNICLGVFNACYAGGIRAFEFTNRGENALESFKFLQRTAKDFPGYILGAGTVLNERDAEAFIEAGASFIVSPCFIESVSDTCYQNKIPYMPGCMTVKEVHYAMESGCEIIKVFPGEVLGTSFVKAVKAVFPKVQLMVTGGVSPTKESLSSWFSAGVAAVGMGSLLFKKEWLEGRKFDALEEAVAKCFQYLK